MKAARRRREIPRHYHTENEVVVAQMHAIIGLSRPRATRFSRKMAKKGLLRTFTSHAKGSGEPRLASIEVIPQARSINPAQVLELEGRARQLVMVMEWMKGLASGRRKRARFRFWLGRRPARFPRISPCLRTFRHGYR